jgi:hypothetical protein
MAMIRSVTRLGRGAARCSALVLTVVTLVGLHSTAETKPIAPQSTCDNNYLVCKIDCVQDDVDKELKCIKNCGAKLRQCRSDAKVPPPKPTKSTNANYGTSGPRNTRFPSGTPVSGLPPKANTSIGGTSMTLGGGVINGPGTNAVSTSGGNAIGISGASATGVSGPNATGTSGPNAAGISGPSAIGISGGNAIGISGARTPGLRK